MERPMDEVKSELEADPTGKAAQAKHSAFSEVCHILSLVEEQVQGKIDEIEKKSEVDMGETCEMVLQYSRSGLGDDGGDSATAIRMDCEALQSLNSDPRLAALPASMPSKPLSEYGPEDVQNTPETTEALLGQIIRWEGLCGGKTRKTALELLTRPPPKFLLDVTLSVKGMTGFPANIEADWPDARDGKLSRFQLIADTVAQVLGTTIDFDPADVLKGKEVQKTLHLLQLLAVAAAKSQPVGGSGHGASSRKAGVARPRELSTLLEAMMRCILGVKQRVEDQRKAIEATTSTGEQSLEQQIVVIQEQLQEESRLRLRQEETLGNAERSLQEVQNDIRHVEAEFELNSAAAKDPEEEELTRQLDALLRDASNPEAIPAEDIIRMLGSQVEEVRRALQQDEGDKSTLEDNHKDLAKKLHESVSQAKAVEAEVQRERQRRDMEEELMGQSPEEQKLILEAHEKKTRMRTETIEAQISGLQAEARDRKTAIATQEESKLDLSRQVEDAQVQMEIVQEERDALREAMEQLFNEKRAVEEELDERQEAYVHLTERINCLNDQTCELQDTVMMKAQGLQKNGYCMPGAPAA